MTYYATAIRMKKGRKTSGSPKDIVAIELADPSLVKHPDSRRWVLVDDLICLMEIEARDKIKYPTKIHPYVKGCMKLWCVPWTAQDGTKYLRTEHVTDTTSDPLMRLPRKDGAYNVQSKA